MLPTPGLGRLIDRAPAALTVSVAIDPAGAPAAAWGEGAPPGTRPMSIASVGKLLLLIEVARQIGIGELDPAEPLTARPEDQVADSGIWQHLHRTTLSVADLATLVGAVSDNLATNVLLRRVGTDAVTAVANDLGLTHTRLHDRVRDERTAGHPPRLATGTAVELAGLLGALDRAEVLGSEQVSRFVLDRLAINTDLSMVAAGAGLDPLAHTVPDLGLRLWNKTGTDAGVRVDTGVLAGARGRLAYAVLVGWTAGTDEVRVRRAALDLMAGIGRELAGAVRG